MGNVVSCHSGRRTFVFGLALGLLIGLISGLFGGYLAWRGSIARTPPNEQRAEIVDTAKPVSASDFIRHPEKYKGQRIRLAMFAERGRISEHGTLQELAGNRIKFYLSGQIGGVIVLDLPPELSLPPAKHLESVVVSFVCNEGDLSKGNQVLSVKQLENYANLP